jgi:iron complex outermembrane receptor protein
MGLPCIAMASAQEASKPLPDVEVRAHRNPTSNHAAHGKPKPSQPTPALATPIPSRMPASVSANQISAQSIAVSRAASPDSAQTLRDIAGVSFYTGGGFSSLPVINGMNDERNAILLGGAAITPACANHMNPPLSYIDPGAIGRIEVVTNNVPVSIGGDSIGGSIIVTPAEPLFAPAVPLQANGHAQDFVSSGSVSTFYRSNGNSFSVSGSAAVANDHYSVSYTGAWSKADDYRAGGGQIIRSTLYEGQNHSGTIAYRNEDQLISARVGYQDIPYQGFVNQWMDMTGNQAETVDLTYKGGFAWGAVEANAYYHNVNHYMNFLADKNGGTDATTTSGMPMYTHGQDFGYSIKDESIVSRVDKLRVGNEFHGQLYNEWWTAVAGMDPMMGPGTFQNINNGTRDRFGNYVEWEHYWTKQWSSLLGVRNDVVYMNTGNVQGYCNASYGPMCDAMTSYVTDANNFNAQSHAKTDVNFDVTAIGRYSPDDASTYEAGYTRKTRSPNLYERYAWSTGGMMGMSSAMIGWFGDGNGYVGNLQLKPEIANTVSTSAGWRDPYRSKWEFKVTPYYSYVQNYIDVDYLYTTMSGTNVLQFANHDAEMYGFNMSGRTILAETLDYGVFSLSGNGGYTRGWRVDNGQSLYHMMPLNGKAAVENKIALWTGKFTSAIEIQAAAAKTDVEAVRLEPTTPAYAVLNLRMYYEINNLRFDAGVENLFDKLYYNPLGGINIGNFDYGDNANLHTPVAAMGRTIYLGLTAKL